MLQVAVRPTTIDAEFATLAGFVTDDDAYFFALFKLICFVFSLFFLLQIEFSFHATNLNIVYTLLYYIYIYIKAAGVSN